MKDTKKGLFSGMPFMALFVIAMVALAGAGILFAQPAQPVPQTQTSTDYQVSVLPGQSGSEQLVSVTVFQLATTGKKQDIADDKNTLLSALSTWQADRAKATEDAVTRLKDAIKNTKSTLSTVKDAEVEMSYTRNGESQALNCAGSSTNKLTLDNPITKDAQGNKLQDSLGKPITMYSKDCVVPKKDAQGKSIYEGTCTQVVAKYTTERGISYVGTTNVCDRTLGGTDDISAGLTEFFTDEKNAPLFIASFALFGLLLASMYFSGRSPISLLDITTPRLPSPKAFTAGGQMIGAFGYSEMKKATLDHRKALGTVIKTTSGLIAAGSSIAGRNAVEGNAKKLKLTPGDAAVLGEKERSETFAKGVGYAALSAGGVQRVNEVAGLVNTHVYGWTQEQHRLFNEKVISPLEKKGGRDALFAGALRDDYMSTLQFKRLETLTGHAGEAGRPAGIQTVQSITGIIRGPGRVGELVGSTVDSSFRAVKMGGTAVAGLVGMAGSAVGGKKFDTAMQQLRSKKGGEWLEGQLLSASGSRIKVGEIGRIDMSMAAAYKEMDAEAHRDIGMYAATQVFKRHGIDLQLSREEMVSLAHNNIDISARCRISSAALHEIQAFEVEMQRILRQSNMDIRQKTEAILELAQHTHGATIDARVRSEMAALGAIRDSRNHDHVKMIAISTHLDEHHMSVRNAIPHENEFRYNIGRDLGEHNTFSAMVMRKYFADAESGMSFTLLEEARAGQMHIINRLVTCDPLSGENKLNLPEFMLASGPAAFEANRDMIRRTIVDLLTDEGREAFRARNNGKDVAHATFEEAFAMLTKGQLKEKGIYGNLEAEHAPSTWFKVGMEGHWVAGIDDRFQYNLATHVNNFFQRSYQSPSNAAVERECLELHSDFHTWNAERQMALMKKVWVGQYLTEDINQLMRSVYAPAGYGAHVQSTPYMQQMQGILREAVRVRGGNQALEEEIDHLRLDMPRDKERLRSLLQNYNDDVQAYMKRGVKYDDVSKGKNAWVLRSEGDFVPYVHGMMVHDNDRIVGGYLAYRDDKGRWQRFKPNETEVRFEGRTDLNAALNMLSREQDHSRPVRMPDGRTFSWQTYIREVDAWAASHGQEGAKMAAVVKYRCGNATGDWTQVSENVRVVAKRDVTPDMPHVLRNVPGLETFATRARNALLGLGDFASQTMMGMGGMGNARGEGMIQSSYAITPFSGAMKQHAWGMAREIATANWDEILRGMPKEEARKVRAQYEAMAKSQNAYFQIWLVSIDRHPAAASSSYGHQQAQSAFFNRGPGDTFKVKDVTGWMPDAERRSFMLQAGWQMKLAQTVFKPFVAAFRTAQQATQGYASRHDEFGQNALRLSNTAGGPRFREFVSSFNPLASFRSWALPDSRFLPSSAQRTMTAGKPFQLGLGVSTPDMWKRNREGMAAIARELEANPGQEWIDYNRRAHMDPRMASYLAFRSGDASMGFFQADEKVMKEATRATHKRTVAAEHKLATAESELSGFGLMQNMQLNKFLSPAFFGYKYLVQPLLGVGQSWKMRGGGWDGTVNTIKERARNASEAVKRTATPWDEQQRRTCACGMPGKIGGKCIACGRNILGSNITNWSSKPANDASNWDRARKAA